MYRTDEMHCETTTNLFGAIVIMEYPLQTLLVTRPGRMRDALRASLNVLPHIASVSIADELEFALLLAADRHIDLVILDLDCAGGSIENAIELVRSQWPHARCLALAGSIGQHRAALEAGADGDLMYGFQFSQLETAIEELFLTPPENNHAQAHNAHTLSPVDGLA